MKYNLETTKYFARDFKKLARKRPFLQQDFDEFLVYFDHTKGEVIPGTSGAQKIKMKATGLGKSKSYRLIYYFMLKDTVYLLKIYSKSIKEDISQNEKKIIKKLIHDIELQRSHLA